MILSKKLSHYNMILKLKLCQHDMILTKKNY